MKKKTQDTKPVNPKPQIEVKLIKHTFTQDELVDLGLTLARAHSNLAEIGAEFDQVKANFKSREAEQEAIIGRASSARMAGYEQRNAKCRVVFRTKERQKDYYLEFDPEDAKPVLTEPMTDYDMQAQLIADEPKWECRETIMVWQGAGSTGSIEVGRLQTNTKPFWFAAASAMVGDRVLAETLDNNQPCATKRIDVIKRATKRLNEWLIEALGDETAEGFREAISEVITSQKEREE